MTQTTFKVNELLALLRSGKVDVLECQRLFERDARWVAQLISSTVTPCPINALLLWVPEAQDRPAGGRYYKSTDADHFIIDGQQRCTALLAAIGQRPPWMPEEEWLAVGGTDLEVCVGIDRHDQPHFRPLKNALRGDIPLSALLVEGESIVDALALKNLASDGHIVEQFSAIGSTIKNFEIHVQWVYGTTVHADKCFLLCNQKTTQTSLKKEQFELGLLTHRFRPFQRDFVTPTIRQAQRRAMGKVVTERSMNRMAQHLLPAEFRGERALEATSDLVEDLAGQLAASAKGALAYLESLGIQHEQLLPFQSILEVLVILIARYPQARSDTFLGHWLAHVHATGEYHGQGTIRARIKDILSSSTYEQAMVAISRDAPVGRPAPFGPGKVAAPPVKGKFGTAGFLWALACGAKTSGLVTDLSDSSIVYPNKAMTLHPLVVDPIRGWVAHYTFMTDDTAALIRRYGGWTSEAYEQLRPPAQTLAAHQLTRPHAGAAERDPREALETDRVNRLAATIDSYLRTVAPLPGRNLATQSVLFEAGN